MPKQTTLQKVQANLPPLMDNEASLDFLVPQILTQWGELAGVSVADEGDMEEAYKEVSTTVAHLLGLLGKDTIRPEVVESVSKRWAATVNPWIALGARVNALHDAYREAPEDVPQATERLWAALEYRAQAITGSKFEEVVL